MKFAFVTDFRDMMKSLNSNHRSFVEFQNYTDRTVEILWVNYSSQLISYGKISPKGKKQMNTFGSHPWVFQDPDSGERMMVDGKSVYMPEPYKDGQRTRIPVAIHFPLRSLKHNSIWTIAKNLTDKQDIDELELPRALSEEIQDALKQIEDAKKLANP